MWWLVALGACSGDETHPCDAGTPTCESSMVIELPDPRTQFELTVTDELGLDLALTCPNSESIYEQDGVTIVCGGGTVILYQLGPFGDAVTIQLEEAEEHTYTPDWQLGADYCGNACTLGTIALR